VIHELKTWPEYWQDVFDNLKNFEVRFNDRDFKVGDLLFLREWDPKTETYTGRVTRRNVIYTLDNPQYVKEGYIIMGLE
jgi:hypothetical protein